MGFQGPHVARAQGRAGLGLSGSTERPCPRPPGTPRARGASHPWAFAHRAAGLQDLEKRPTEDCPLPSWTVTDPSGRNAICTEEGQKQPSAHVVPGGGRGGAVRVRARWPDVALWSSRPSPGHPHRHPDGRGE